MTKHTNQVVVLYGGRSGEHEVSLVSAASVIKNLDRNLFDIIPIGVDREGLWWLNQLNEVDPVSGKELIVKASSAKQIEPTDFFRHHADCVVFPVMHGTFCEDGKMQGLLESSNVPYVGAGVLSSAICMDKDVAKRLMLQCGIPTVPYVSFNKGQWQQNSAAILERIAKELGTVLFVKPANMGSSVGCTKVKETGDLKAAIDFAFQYDVKIMVEHAVNAREVECSVLENPDYGKPPLTSVLGEIITQHEFYDYEAKYHDDTLKLVIPAKVDEPIAKEMQLIAAHAFQVMECEGMARVDFFIDKDSGEIYLNELNTLPGFTNVSMYPMMWLASGLAYADLLTKLIQLAAARYKRHAALKVTLN